MEHDLVLIVQDVEETSYMLLDNLYMQLKHFFFSKWVWYFINCIERPRKYSFFFSLQIIADQTSDCERWMICNYL